MRWLSYLSLVFILTVYAVLAYLEGMYAWTSSIWARNDAGIGDMVLGWAIWAVLAHPFLALTSLVIICFIILQVEEQILDRADARRSVL